MAALTTKDPNTQNVKPVVIPAHLQAADTVTSPTTDTVRAKTTPIIISIEAAIGTGKSSLLRLLERTLGRDKKWVVVQEPVEQWQKIGGKHNLLAAYYDNQERFAFSFQTNCVLSRIRALQDVLRTTPSETEVIVLERCWASDRNTFGEMLRRDKKISELEWALYEEWYRFAVENAPFIDGHVYLDADTETCMDRLRKRDRTEETGVTESYQRALIQCHEQWLDTLPVQERVCRLEVNQEFISDSDNSKRIVDSVASFIEQLQTMRATAQ
jgi:deoxyadenosine/deoxycytidine kinase